VARINPRLALRLLGRVAAATAVKGKRGEAEATAPLLLKILQRTAAGRA
jgi:hypothetical protein